MKKTIKILILTLLILLTVGITTSKAVTTISAGTSVNSIIAGLESGDKKIRISTSVRKQNVNIFCRQYGQVLSVSDFYIDSSAPNISNNSKAAYVLSSSYDKDTRQKAYWNVLGQNSTENNLAKEAKAYYNFISNYNANVSINKSNAITEYNGNTKTYGPITINYNTTSYNNKSFGGFYYAFVNQSGEQINSGISLCNVGGTTDIGSGSRTINGISYKEVGSGYSNKNLSIRVTDSNINWARLVVKSWKLSVSVEYKQIEGKKIKEGISYCTVCEDNITNSITVNNSTINDMDWNHSSMPLLKSAGNILGIEGQYWKFKNTTIEYTNENKNKFKFMGVCSDNMPVNITIDGTSLTESTGRFLCKGCNNGIAYANATAFKNHIISNPSNHETSETAFFIICKVCGEPFSTEEELAQHYWDRHKSEAYKRTIYNYIPWIPGCGNSGCGKLRPVGYKEQHLTVYCGKTITKALGNEAYIDMEFEPAIQKLTLVKVDAENGNKLSGAEFTATFGNVKSYNIGNQKFAGNKPYTFTVNQSIAITNVVFQDKLQPITVTITETKAPNGTSSYYYKKLDGTITIKIGFANNGLTNQGVSYNGTDNINNSNISISGFQVTLNVPNIRLIDVSGTVWIDGNTGVKPVIAPNGTMENTEMKVSNVLVKLSGDNMELYGADGKLLSLTDANTTTKTNSNGTYQFKGLRYGRNYLVTFNYDGVHYTTPSVTNYTNQANNAIEVNRADFNTKFQTIKYNQTATGIALDYAYDNKVSNLNTLSVENEGNVKYPIVVDGHLEMGNVKTEFNMTANTTKTQYTANTTNLNLGLVRRGADFALATNLLNADVIINGKTTTYNCLDLTTYSDTNVNDSNIVIDLRKSKEIVPEYNLFLYSSDYNYRIRDYVNSQAMNDYYYDDNIAPDGTKTGDELEVNVTYTLQIENQANVAATVKEIKYNLDEKYTLNRIYTIENGEQNAITEYSVNGNIITITKTIDFNGYGVKTLYVEFKVNKEDEGSLKDALKTGVFNNTAEVTSYSTAEGLIDLDSQPGNYINNTQIEDDCDEASGVNIEIKENEIRTISGTVFDQDNKNIKVDNVIVQLIEIKEVNGKNYEYIWQETVSGTNKVKAMKYDGTSLVTYETDVAQGSGNYKFLDYVELEDNTVVGFIPGNYIVRFIYGDGTTYELTDSTLSSRVKYNGQDYKSALNSNFADEWFDQSKYQAGASVARDNEARRLENMAWSVNVDPEKGLLLKLLNLQDPEKISDYVDNYLSINKVEKTTFISVYNKYLSPDIEDVTTQNVKDLMATITLNGTWMCADTAKINVPVDSESNQVSGENTTTVTPGNSYIKDIAEINLGLLKRPETKIEIEKKLTQMVLRASNGQTLVSAYFDGNEIQGQTDGLQVINLPGGEGKWIFSVSPTDINTVIDGASLEYTYKIIVKNTGSEDTLNQNLTTAYNDNTINYERFLRTIADNVKTENDDNYFLGKYLGAGYYNGETGSVVKTEVTSIYDYINNELSAFEEGTKNLRNKGNMNHYLLNDAFNPISLQVNTVLETTVPTGKMAPSDLYNEYEVTLGKNPLSSTSTLDFMNYVAEVMSYTNAAGRRTLTSTPGNAEAVNKFKAIALEEDEARVEEVQIEPALGEDGKTNNIWLISIISGVIVIAAGAFIIKKYIVK